MLEVFRKPETPLWQEECPGLRSNSPKKGGERFCFDTLVLDNARRMEVAVGGRTPPASGETIGLATAVAWHAVP